MLVIMYCLKGMPFLYMLITVFDYSIILILTPLYCVGKDDYKRYVFNKGDVIIYRGD